LAFLGGLVFGALKFVRARLLGWASVAQWRSCSPRAQPGPLATSANAPLFATFRKEEIGAANISCQS
jgi:hypothetical protein